MNSPGPFPTHTSPGPSGQGLNFPTAPNLTDPSATAVAATTATTPTTTATILPSTTKPSSSKTPPAPNVCQVEDCRAPLEGLKEFHQRYKICDFHLKLESITRFGEKLRFCQQCGKFQPLEEFDGAKRSCRARLQRHNARRRKRPREGEGGEQLSGPELTAMDAGFTAKDMGTLEDAMQFAAANVMMAAAAAADAADIDPPNTNTPNNNVASVASAAIAAMPFGVQPTHPMPFVPTKAVMQLLLKAYAGMFHYSIESLHIRPRAEVTPLESLSMVAPSTVGAGAGAAAAPAVPLLHGNPHENGVGDGNRNGNRNGNGNGNAGGVKRAKEVEEPHQRGDGG